MTRNRCWPACPGIGDRPTTQAFGGGTGLVRPDSSPIGHRAAFTPASRRPPVSGDKVRVAGEAGGHRSSLPGTTSDGTSSTQSFGNSGFAAPPIVGAGRRRLQTEGKPASSWAERRRGTGAGGAVAGRRHRAMGRLGVPYQRDMPRTAAECPQPMLVRFDTAGKPRPSFGSGGLLRLAKPDGSDLRRRSRPRFAPLADGRLLVKGSIPTAGTGPQPWVARLNPDGSYDKSFGQRRTDGAALPLHRSAARRTAVGRLRRLGPGRPAGARPAQRPAHSLAAGPGRTSPGRRSANSASSCLPRLRLAKHPKSKLRILGAGDGTEAHFGSCRTGQHGPQPEPAEDPRCPGTAGEAATRRASPGPPAPAAPPQALLLFRIGIAFPRLVGAPEYGGNQTIVRRAG